jgi:hypothetical protein
MTDKRVLKFFIATFLLLGFAAACFAHKEETLPQLIARAEAAKPDHQPDLYMEIAERQRQAASNELKAERWDEFRADLKEVEKNCDKAHKAAIASSKHIKNTEIKIRRILTHLKETKLDVSVDDQPTVQKVIDQLEQFRTELLRNMFGGKGDD